MDLKNLTDKAEDALEDTADKIAGAVPASMKRKASGLADKAVLVATDLIGKAADKMEGK